MKSFTHEGKVYTEQVGGGECIGCAFCTDEDCNAPFESIPACHHVDRTDGQDVIFIEVQSENQTLVNILIVCLAIGSFLVIGNLIPREWYGSAANPNYKCK